MSPLPDGVTIRRATPDDAPALADLHLDGWDDAYTGLMDQSILDERRANLTRRIERWREILAEPHGNLLAVGPEGLVGFAGAGPGRDNDVDLDLELMALYVRAAWWGTGIGYALLREAIGDRAAYLWVLDGNDRAMAFYRRHGFSDEGGRKPDLDTGAVEIRMARGHTAQ